MHNTSRSKKLKNVKSSHMPVINMRSHLSLFGWSCKDISGSFSHTKLGSQFYPEAPLALWTSFFNTGGFQAGSLHGKHTKWTLYLPQTSSNQKLLSEVPLQLSVLNVSILIWTSRTCVPLSVLDISSGY